MAGAEGHARYTGCVLVDRYFVTVLVSDFGAKNSSPNCFLNAPTVLKEIKFIFYVHQLQGFYRLWSFCLPQKILTFTLFWIIIETV